MLNAVIIFMVCMSCIPYYFKYEKEETTDKRKCRACIDDRIDGCIRMLFAFSPGFKPVSAMVIICGMAFGRESGFLCGSLSAVVSNLFFWTRIHGLHFRCLHGNDRMDLKNLNQKMVGKQ